MTETVISFSLLELFQMGGPIMWPLLLFSIISVAIIMERGFYLIYYNLRLDDLKEIVEKAIINKDLDKTREYLESKTKRRMGARVLLALVKRSGLSEQRLEKAVEAEALTCISSLENGFNFLTALASISPLTGFLGTVTGMIGAFRSISEAVDINAQIVASGIYEALITTVFGLIIAITAMTAHSLYSHVVDKFASEMEVICSDLIIALGDSNENKKK